MKTLKLNLKTTFITTAIVAGLVLSCQIEDTQENNLGVDENSEILTEDDGLSAKAGSETNCSPSGRGDNDYKNPINIGYLDDRTCYADYYETTISGKKYGVYEIRHNSNHIDNSTLQPRMERSLTPRVNKKVGNYDKLSATFRISKVGITGTYIMQTKGKHTGGGGSPDPAICLYIAKDVVVNGVVTHFDIYREQITKRGGTLQDGGRIEVKLARVAKDTDFTVTLKTGFATKNNALNHYSNITINGNIYNYDIPEAERALETGIRYGAYRVAAGYAKILVRNTIRESVNK